MILGVEAELAVRWLGFALGALIVYQAASGYFMRRSRVAQARKAHRWAGATMVLIAATHAVIALGFQH